MASASAYDSSDGESGGEGDFLSPGSSLSNPSAYDSDSAPGSRSANSTRTAARMAGGGGMETSISNQLFVGGSGANMDTIEEETASALRDSPPKRTSPARAQSKQGLRGLQGIVQQQLSEQAAAQQSSELHSGVGSLSQGLGNMLNDAYAAQNEADSSYPAQVSGHAFVCTVVACCLRPLKLLQKGNTRDWVCMPV